MAENEPILDLVPRHLPELREAAAPMFAYLSKLPHGPRRDDALRFLRNAIVASAAAVVAAQTRGGTVSKGKIDELTFPLPDAHHRQR